MSNVYICNANFYFNLLIYLMGINACFLVIPCKTQRFVVSFHCVTLNISESLDMQQINLVGNSCSLAILAVS